MKSFDGIGVTLVALTCFAAGTRADQTQQSSASEATSASLLSGAFTQAQVDSGKALYTANCAGCHGNHLRGSPGGPAVLGLKFRQRWEGVPVGALFSYASALMPPGKAGSLTQEQYLDIVTYLLSRNGYPVGPAPLALDQSALDSIIIEPRKPAENATAVNR